MTKAERIIILVLVIIIITVACGTISVTISDPGDLGTTKSKGSPPPSFWEGEFYWRNRLSKANL